MFEVIWETTANPGETLTQSLVQKRGVALYCMKFDLVLRKLWTILLVQEIREPNHADYVIGHLGHWGWGLCVLSCSLSKACREQEGLHESIGLNTLLFLNTVQEFVSILMKRRYKWAPIPRVVCAPLIPENNALISQNPWKKIPRLPESIFPLLPRQILKINSASPNPQQYNPILPIP